MEGPMGRNDTPVCPCTGPAIADAIAGELRRSGFPEGDVFICDADFAARSSDELSHGRAPSFAPMACAALRARRCHRQYQFGEARNGSRFRCDYLRTAPWHLERARQIKTS